MLAELAGENPFKVRAMANAARAVLRHPQDLAETAAKGELTNIPGIGKGIAALIVETLDRGEPAQLVELRSKLPAGLPDLLSLPGLGAKRARTLWQELGITTPGELEYACRENRLVALAGFGPATQKKLLDAIEFRRHTADKHHLSAGWAAAEETLAALRRALPSCQVEVAGEVRRYCEVITEVVLVCAAATAASVKSAVATVLADVAVSKGGVTGRSPSGPPVRVEARVEPVLRLRPPLAHRRRCPSGATQPARNTARREAGRRHPDGPIGQTFRLRRRAGSVRPVRAALDRSRAARRDGRDRGSRRGDPARARGEGRPARRGARAHHRLGRHRLARRDGSRGSGAWVVAAGNRGPLPGCGLRPRPRRRPPVCPGQGDRDPQRQGGQTASAERARGGHPARRHPRPAQGSAPRFRDGVRALLVPTEPRCADGPPGARAVARAGHDPGAPDGTPAARPGGLPGGPRGGAPGCRERAAPRSRSTPTRSASISTGDGCGAP